MSQFDEVFKASLAPVLTHWHGDPIEYRDLDLADEDQGITIDLALVGEEKRQRRRVNEYEVDLVYVRSVQFIVDADTANYSGVSAPKQDAIVRLSELNELKTYVVENVIDRSSGMAELRLRRVGRVALGTDESLGE